MVVVDVAIVRCSSQLGATVGWAIVVAVGPLGTTASMLALSLWVGGVASHRCGVIGVVSSTISARTVDIAVIVVKSASAVVNRIVR